LNNLGSELPGFVYIEPMGYLEFNYLVKNCMAVITDSGGITEEATVMGVPCLTLRDTTERPETVTVGTNEVIETNPAKWKVAFDRLLEGYWEICGIPEKRDCRTGERLFNLLKSFLKIIRFNI
jgi:UDP-N-acetylglucosamine 2-epimerase (non-hydrolysing)